MRKLLRRIAKAKMKKEGAGKVNKHMNFGNWRQYVNAYPVDVVTGIKMSKGYHGRKHYRKGYRKNHLFFYNFAFRPTKKA